MSMSKSSLLAAPSDTPTATTSCTPLTSRAPSAACASLSSRSRALLALVALALPSLVCASCLNPKDDYNDYVTRAADAQVPAPPISTEASTVDVASLHAPDGGFSDNNLVMICVAFQLGADISKALLWQTQIVYTGGASGGTVSFLSKPLAAGSTSVDSPLSGPDISVTNIKVTEHGYAAINIAQNLDFPASFNAITGAPVELQHAQVLLQMESPTQICANLGGFIPEPAPVTLDPTQNACIFLPTDSGGHWATVQTADVHCP